MKIKVLAIGGGNNLLNEFRGALKELHEQFSFVQTDFEGFVYTQIEFNILLFLLNPETISAINNLHINKKVKPDTPIILLYEDEHYEYLLSKLYFKNKMVFNKASNALEIKYNILIMLKKVELEYKLRDFENRVGGLKNEIENLKTELDFNKINLQELSETNNHLVSATWRERELKKRILEELEQVKKENEINKINISELSVTNEHLVSATFREREMRIQLNSALKEVENSQKVIENQNRRISESINYSKNIQEALNPSNEMLMKYFKESCMILLPKDVISGDFPWLYDTEEYLYIAAVDCTGHGVPGAMMSVIGALLLNGIMEHEKDLKPGEILDRLHQRVVKTLKQDSSTNNSNDGMDVSLVRFNKKFRTLEFSGAHRPVLHFKKGDCVVEVKGDKFPIGGLHHERNRKPFQNFEIRVEAGDSILMFSDGLCDQPGGPDMKKLGMSGLVDFIKNQVGLSMDMFNAQVISFLKEWRGDLKQIDDIIMIGVEF